MSHDRPTFDVVLVGHLVRGARRDADELCTRWERHFPPQRVAEMLRNDSVDIAAGYALVYKAAFHERALELIAILESQS